MHHLRRVHTEYTLCMMKRLFKKQKRRRARKEARNYIKQH